LLGVNEEINFRGMRWLREPVFSVEYSGIFPGRKLCRILICRPFLSRCNFSPIRSTRELFTVIIASPILPMVQFLSCNPFYINVIYNKWSFSFHFLTMWHNNFFFILFYLSFTRAQNIIFGVEIFWKILLHKLISK